MWWVGCGGVVVGAVVLVGGGGWCVEGWEMVCVVRSVGVIGWARVRGVGLLVWEMCCDVCWGVAG